MARICGDQISAPSHFIGKFPIFERYHQVPKYVTIGYGDEAGYERTAPQVRVAAHDHDLVPSGALVEMAGPPVQVRNPDDSGVKTHSAAFMSSPLPIAGFAVIEAANLNEAIILVSKSPCAIAHGVVEIRPLVSAQNHQRECGYGPMTR